MPSNTSQGEELHLAPYGIFDAKNLRSFHKCYKHTYIYIYIYIYIYTYTYIIYFILKYLLCLKDARPIWVWMLVSSFGHWDHKAYSVSQQSKVTKGATRKGESPKSSFWPNMLKFYCYMQNKVTHMALKCILIYECVKYLMCICFQYALPFSCFSFSTPHS